MVNAQHIKHVTGRKTDIKDAQWIGELLQHELLKASYIPQVEQRDLRELTRYRTKLVQERTREINRVQKVLEDANIKLGSVASKVLSVSGREMIEQLIAGQDDPTELAQLARGRLRKQIAELEKALAGYVRETHRVLLRIHLEHIDDLNAKIMLLNDEIDRLLASFDTIGALERLDTIPGVNRVVAEVILAELGTDMSRFPTPSHAASWAGLAPGKHESAGKNRSGKSPPGNKHLKAALVQAAHTVGRSKGHYLAVRRLAARWQKACGGCCSFNLVIAYHIIERGTVYTDLGGDYFDAHEHHTHRLVKRLQTVGV